MQHEPAPIKLPPATYQTVRARRSPSVLGDALSGEIEVRDAVPYGVRQQNRLLSINSTFHDLQSGRRSMDAWYLLGLGDVWAGCSTTF